MQITRNGSETATGPDEWFTGAVYIDPVAAPSGASHVNASSVHFTPGDRVFFELGEDHWHGAAPTRFMTHLSIVEVDESGNSATWGAHVTDEEYEATPRIAET
jgi:quercetin dioxygenase-like cupin family protein